MASIYRFSFEHDIVPNGVTLVSGSIWSGQGRMGQNTNALTATTRAVSASVWTEIDVDLPANTTGLRGSYYTKASDNFVYPSKLVQAGPYELQLLSNSASAILFNGTVIGTQDITYVEDNRWNLVRFFVDFDGTSSTGSIEFNGIRLDASSATDSTTGINTVAIRGLVGALSCIDDVGLNDNTGLLEEDKGVPNAVMGFVGGLVEDGDIQNWQQNVASLFPINYLRKNQAHFAYIPSSNELICSSIGTPQNPLSQTNFTIIDADTHVEKRRFVESVNISEKIWYPVFSQSRVENEYHNGYVTIITPTAVTESINTYFDIQTVTYNDSDGLVYLMGASKTETKMYEKIKASDGKYYYTPRASNDLDTQSMYAYKTYDPINVTQSALVTWLGDFNVSPPVWVGDNHGYSTVGYEYRFRDVLATIFCPLNSKMYSLVSVYNPYFPHTTVRSDQNPMAQPNYVENKSWLQMLVLDPKINKIELSYKYYGMWTHFAGGTDSVAWRSTYSTPKTAMVWNPYDQTICTWCAKFDQDPYASFFLRSIEPESLTIKKSKSVRMEETEVLAPQLAQGEISTDLCYSNINNTIYVATYQDVYDTSQIYEVDLTTRTGSLLFPKGIGTTIRKLIYSPARNAVYALGEIDSFVFDPVKATYVNDVRHEFGVTSTEWLDLAENGTLLSGSILESVPLYNIQDGVYVPKNSAIVAASYEKVYRLMGSMESSVVNALINPDSLKAGATASGDICTIKIAKPTGSFTSKYRYEGFNIRIDNASSMTTASLKIGVRDAGVNTSLGDPVVTWANSTGSHVRSIFTRFDQGGQKWSGSQFDGVQFYMEAGD